jgi:hypothetical protein
MSVFDAYVAAAESVISDAGEPVTVYRESSSSQNRYGNPVETEAQVGTETVVLYYGTRSNRAELMADPQGSFVERRPRLMFSLSANIEQDDVLVFSENAARLRVDAITRLPTHVEATAQVETDLMD